jgi:hypothetical protein
MTRSGALVTVLLIVAAQSALAQSNPSASEMGTPEQRSACGPDVGRYCKSVRPEEGPFAYLACLQRNRSKLRPACVKVIEGPGQ